MGEVHEVTELITPGPAQALAGLLGVPEVDEELPLLWHWVYLLDRPPQDALGPDGHQHRGGMPVPPGPGLRRMFAGGRVSRHGPLRIGSEATRRTWQASSARKQGRSGPLVFVTVRTEVSQGGQVVIAEEQDLVIDPRAMNEVELCVIDHTKISAANFGTERGACRNHVECGSHGHTQSRAGLYGPPITYGKIADSQ